MTDSGGELHGPLLPVLAATRGIAALLRRLGLSTIAGYLAADAPLAAGDVLVLEGTEEALTEAADRSLDGS